MNMSSSSSYLLVVLLERHVSAEVAGVVDGLQLAEDVVRGAVHPGLILLIAVLEMKVEPYST